MSARPQRILVVGGGGREHALAWRIRHDRPGCELFAAPGNGGIAELATLVPIGAADIEGISAWCRERSPDLVVIGPDEPLALGLVDALAADGIRAFGPSAAAARIESSKAWAAEVGRAAGLPMPETHVLESADEADAFIREQGRPFVVKADGLALGKGVVVCRSMAESHAAIDRLARRRELGAAGERLVLQAPLEGEEVSVFAICDGARMRVIGSARDHKRALDGDRGPNTGGMGAYTPVPGMDADRLAAIEAAILAPVVDELRRRGCPFVGFLYAGLMLTADGPRVIEFNARMGDPEAQVILPLIDFDLVATMEQAADGVLPATLPPSAAGASSRAAVCVVVASEGYPGPSPTDRAIAGLDDVAAVAPDTIRFHAGTRREGSRWLTSGGRVLGVTGLGATLREARDRAYAGVGAIHFEGLVHRSDIAAGVA